MRNKQRVRESTYIEKKKRTDDKTQYSSQLKRKNRCARDYITLYVYIFDAIIVAMQQLSQCRHCIV